MRSVVLSRNGGDIALPLGLGTMAYEDAADYEIGVAIQPYDADLAAIAGVSSSGLLARTGSGTAAARTIVGESGVLSVSAGNGVSGNPTLSLDANGIGVTKLLQVSTGTVLGRSSASTGNLEVLSTLPTGVQDNITRLGTIASGTWNASLIGIAYGGTGVNNASAGSGTFLRGNGTGFAVSTLTLPNTLTANQVLYGTGTNAVGASANLTNDGAKVKVTGSGGNLQIDPTITGSSAFPLDVKATITDQDNFAQFNVGGSFNNTTAKTNQYGLLFQPTFTNTASLSSSTYGINATVNLAPTMTLATDVGFTSVVAMQGALQIQSTATQGTITEGSAFIAFRPRNIKSGGTFAFTRMFGVQVQNQGSLSGFAGATVTSAVGLGTADQVAATNNTNLLLGTLTPPSGNYSIHNASASQNVHAGKSFFGGTTSPTATVEVAAGTTSVAPVRFTLGSAALLTSPITGALEAISDKLHYTISTGTARKEITLNDAALTSGRAPLITTNGRLTDNANYVADGTQLGVGTGTPGTVNSTALTGKFLHLRNASGTAQLVADGTGRGSLILNASSSTANSRLFQLRSDSDLFQIVAWNDNETEKNVIVTATPAGAFKLPTIGTTASAANVFADSGDSNNLLRSTSSGRYKSGAELLAIDEARAIVIGAAKGAISYASLAPADKPWKRHIGFYAEHINPIDSRLVHYNREGLPESVQYERFVVPLTVVVADHEERLRRAGI